MPSVLIASIHPDDEVLGCGGALLRHREMGDRVHWLILTTMHEDRGWSPERVAERGREIKEVAGMLEATVHEVGVPTLEMHAADRTHVVAQIGNIATAVEPDVLYVPNRSDVHSDHRFGFEFLLPLTKKFRYPSIRRVLMYECLSETEFAPPLPEAAFTPNWYVDISDYLEEKIRLMEVYRSEIGPHPFPRSERAIRAQATLRGSVAGVESAEAFMLLREVVS